MCDSCVVLVVLDRYFGFAGGTDAEFDYYLAQDLMKAGISVVLVFLVLWAATDSLFITSCGLFQILVSFPIGMFVWIVVMDEPGITYLMYNGIFIILGIGCDDIFVFMVT